MNIKPIVKYILVFIGLNMFAQAETSSTITKEDSTAQMWEDDHYLNIRFGLYQPISIGDNFANRAMSQSLGFEIDAMLNLGTSKLLVGLYYSQFQAKVTGVAQIGNYEKARVSSIGPSIGYHIIRTPSWRAILSFGAGQCEYINKKGSIKFQDTGAAIWLNPSVQYHFNKAFGVYMSSSLRRDILEIEAPEGYNDFFKGATYLNISLGLNIVL